MNPMTLIDELSCTHTLSLKAYHFLIAAFDAETAAYARQKADAARREIYGNAVFFRGLIEIGNICKNDCLYCGIRHSNRQCQRYRLTPAEILHCCTEGYSLGFRTFVLQGGEDNFFSDSLLADLISQMKRQFPDCAVTLSLGERDTESYRILRNAGTDRYLLRHETANAAHYAQLHPATMSYEHRMQSLRDLRSLGYQTGCGFMVGSPYQTAEHLAQDLKFIEEFAPDMCGIGPFIPHHATPFAAFAAGSVSLTCYLLSLLRLIKPNMLLPATTALSTLDPNGRTRGLLAGANVVMPNLSPQSVRQKYELYEKKAYAGSESAQGLAALRKSIQSVGFELVSDRGDIKFSKGEDTL